MSFFAEKKLVTTADTDNSVKQFVQGLLAVIHWEECVLMVRCSGQTVNRRGFGRLRATYLKVNFGLGLGRAKWSSGLPM
jgi:hypothetical protein